jgi:hypothetical protein
MKKLEKLEKLLSKDNELNKLLKTNIFLNPDCNLYLEMVNLNKVGLDTLNEVHIYVFTN